MPRAAQVVLRRLVRDESQAPRLGVDCQCETGCARVLRETPEPCDDATLRGIHVVTPSAASALSKSFAVCRVPSVLSRRYISTTSGNA